MSGIIYRSAPMVAERFENLGVQNIGIDGTNRPRVIRRSGGHRFLFFLQLHTAGQIGDASVRENATIVWPPGTDHVYGNNRLPWTNSWILFSGAQSLPLFRRSGLPLGMPFFMRRPEIFRKYLHLFLDEFRFNMHPDESILRNLYSNLLTEIGRDLASSGGGPDIPEHMLSLKFFLDTRYHEHITLTKLRDRFHYSPNYLTAEFRRFFGTPLIEYLIGVRMQHARELLGTTDMPVKAVAGECGYQDIHYFSKAFRRSAGSSPSEYRRGQRKGGEVDTDSVSEGNRY